jgi:hypothetical protein
VEGPAQCVQLLAQVHVRSQKRRDAARVPLASERKQLGVEHLELCEATIHRGRFQVCTTPALHPPQWMCDYLDGLRAISCLGEVTAFLLVILLHDGTSRPFNGQRKNSISSPTPHSSSQDCLLTRITLYSTLHHQLLQCSIHL